MTMRKTQSILKQLERNNNIKRTCPIRNVYGTVNSEQKTLLQTTIIVHKGKRLMLIILCL